jgi:hypothetical protein
MFSRRQAFVQGDESAVWILTNESRALAMLQAQSEVCKEEYDTAKSGFFFL